MRTGQFVAFSFGLTALLAAPAQAQLQDKSSRVVGFAAPARAQLPVMPPSCNQPMAEPIAHVPVDGNPGFLAVTSDGCWVFARIKRDRTEGIGVFRRSDGTVSLVRFQSLATDVLSTEPQWSMALTHDNSLLVAREDHRIIFLDVARLIAGSAQPVLGTMTDGHFSDYGGLTITRDDKYLFVAQRGAYWTSVIDLERARRTGFDAKAILGGVPSGGPPPFGLANVLSPDGRFLYAVGRPPTGSPAFVPEAPVKCRRTDNPEVVENGILVIDVQRAIASPGPTAVIAAVSIPCEVSIGVPNVALSPAGDTLYVTVPRDDAMVAFDMRPVLAGGAPRQLARVSVGSAPRSVVTTLDGERIIVANSNTVPGNGSPGPTTLAVLAATDIATGGNRLLATIPSGRNPGFMTVTTDGRTLLLSNIASQTIQVVDLQRLTLTSAR